MQSQSQSRRVCNPTLKQSHHGRDAILRVQSRRVCNPTLKSCGAEAVDFAVGYKPTVTKPPARSNALRVSAVRFFPSRIRNYFRARGRD